MCAASCNLANHRLLLLLLLLLGVRICRSCSSWGGGLLCCILLALLRLRNKGEEVFMHDMIGQSSKPSHSHEGLIAFQGRECSLFVTCGELSGRVWTVTEYMVTFSAADSAFTLALAWLAGTGSWSSLGSSAFPAYTSMYCFLCSSESSFQAAAAWPNKAAKRQLQAQCREILQVLTMPQRGCHRISNEG